MKVPKGQKVHAKLSRDIEARLGLAVRAHRMRLGVTQEELAWRADMHRSYLADIERGGRNVTLRSILNLAQALQVSMAELLAGDERARRAAGAVEGYGEVLLVEDNAADAELALRAFARAKFSNPIRVTDRGRDALDYLRGEGAYRQHGPTLPELVLLDLNLPDMSGVDVLREMKANPASCHIPVVVLTASQHDANILECSRLGGSAYIIKPLGFEKLSQITPRLDFHWALIRGQRVAAEKPRKARSDVAPGVARRAPLDPA